MISSKEEYFNFGMSRDTNRKSKPTCFPINKLRQKCQYFCKKENVECEAKIKVSNNIMVEPIFDFQFRLILIGDSTVGKSSLLKYFTEGKFSDECDPTVGVDFYARLIEVQQGVRVKLQLWDTAGQERFRYYLTLFCRHSFLQMMQTSGFWIIYSKWHHYLILSFGCTVTPSH